MVNYLIVLFAVTLMYFASAERVNNIYQACWNSGVITVWYCYIRA